MYFLINPTFSEKNDQNQEKIQQHQDFNHLLLQIILNQWYDFVIVTEKTFQRIQNGDKNSNCTFIAIEKNPQNMKQLQMFGDNPTLIKKNLNRFFVQYIKSYNVSIMQTKQTTFRTFREMGFEGSFILTPQIEMAHKIAFYTCSRLNNSSFIKDYVENNNTN